MRQLRTRGQKVALVAIVLGTALLLAAGYVALPDDSSDDATDPAPSASTPSPQSTQAERPDASKNPFDPDNGDQLGFGTNGVDPFENAKGDTRLHDVTVTLRSDGPLKWRFRTRAGDGSPQDANRSVSFNKQVRGPLPAAQIQAQVMPGSTYVTCTMSIDGTEVSSTTARKRYQVIACTG